MPSSDEIAKNHGLVHLDDSEDYVRLFKPRDLHWGEAGTIQAIANIARQVREQCGGYRIEVGNITGPNRVNNYSSTHQGRNFDMAYPYADGNSGALDHEGKTNSPYRQKPEEIDFGKLYTLLTLLSSDPLNDHVTIGIRVDKLLHAYVKANAMGPLPKVRPFKGHDDHIHVAMTAS